MADYRKRSKPAELPKEDQQGNNVDLEALANLIANKVSQGIDLPKNSGIIYKDSSKEEDEFDDTSSMDQLAKTMTIQRGDKSSNFDDLGGVKETKKDNDQTNNTIDLLTDLED